MVSNIFMPGVSFNFPMLGCMTRLSRGPLSMRLVVIGPRGFVGRIGSLKAVVVGIRCRTYMRLREIIRRVGSTKVGTTIALGPSAPMTVLTSVVHSISVILLVDIGPNFNNRGFVMRALSGIERLHRLVAGANSRTLVRISKKIGLRANERLMRTKTSILITKGTIFGTPSVSSVVRQLGSL